MSLALVIPIIVVADLALIGLLALVMSRASLLKPHVSTARGAEDGALHATRTVRTPASTPYRGASQRQAVRQLQPDRV
jgi:hypothetical protein